MGSRVPKIPCPKFKMGIRGLDSYINKRTPNVRKDIKKLFQKGPWQRSQGPKEIVLGNIQDFVLYGAGDDFKLVEDLFFKKKKGPWWDPGSLRYRVRNPKWESEALTITSINERQMFASQPTSSTLRKDIKKLFQKGPWQRSQGPKEIVLGNIQDLVLYGAGDNFKLRKCAVCKREIAKCPFKI